MLPNQPSNTNFHQDGAPPHFSVAMRQLMDEILPNSWIERGGRTSWQARFLDLTSFYYFSWGYVKDKVYQPLLSQLS